MCAVRAGEKVEPDRRLIREQSEQVHLLEAEVRLVAAIEHLQDAERAVPDDDGESTAHRNRRTSAFWPTSAAVPVR